MSGKGDWKSWHLKCIDLERQLKEAKDDKDKCQEYGTSLQQQLAEAKARLDSELKHHENCDNKTEHVFQELQQQLQEANERIKILESELYPVEYRQVVQKNIEYQHELTQLRQELVEAKKGITVIDGIMICPHGFNPQGCGICDETNTLRAKLEKMTANCEKIAKHNGEYVAKNNDLRAEVERLKRVNDEYGVEEVGKLVDRVQELESLIKRAIDYIALRVSYCPPNHDCMGCEFIHDAKRALDGGKE